VPFIASERLNALEKSAIRRIYDAAPPGSINLAIGEPDFPTPDVVREAGIAAIREGRVGYTSNAGLPELRRAIAALHQANGVEVTAEGVCVTVGAAEALYVAMMAMAGPGDEVLVPDPGYVAYPAIGQLTGARVTRYRLDPSRNFALDRDTFVRALTRATKLVIVISPSNPTGQILTRDDLTFITQQVKRTGAWVLSDEIYSELHFDERPVSIASILDTCIIVSGLSKSMSMTGWRLGWLAGPVDAIDAMNKLHLYVTACASRITQKAGIAAFTEQGREATASMRDELRARRDLMQAAIERELGLRTLGGAGAFYVMLDVSTFGSSESVAYALLKHKVITVPGAAFGPSGEGFLRVSFSASRQHIEDGVHRIAAGLRAIA
jgi:aspartate aminotransferase